MTSRRTCLQTIFSTPALRVTASLAHMAGSTPHAASVIRSHRRTSSAGTKKNAGAEVVEHILLLATERDAWKDYIMEMVMAHKVLILTVGCTRAWAR